jgi:hypothetical protein
VLPVTTSSATTSDLPLHTSPEHRRGPTGRRKTRESPSGPHNGAKPGPILDSRPEERSSRRSSGSATKSRSPADRGSSGTTSATHVPRGAAVATSADSSPSVRVRRESRSIARSDPSTRYNRDGCSAPNGVLTTSPLAPGALLATAERSVGALGRRKIAVPPTSTTTATVAPAIAVRMLITRPTLVGAYDGR